MQRGNGRGSEARRGPHSHARHPAHTLRAPAPGGAPTVGDDRHARGRDAGAQHRVLLAGVADADHVVHIRQRVLEHLAGGRGLGHGRRAVPSRQAGSEAGIPGELLLRPRKQREGGRSGQAVCTRSARRGISQGSQPLHRRSAPGNFQLASSSHHIGGTAGWPATLFMRMEEASAKPKSEWSVKTTGYPMVRACMMAS